MEYPNPKLTYISNQRRVRCEFMRGFCVANKGYAANLIARAQHKLRAEHEAGNIVLFRIFASRLEKMWRLMIDSDEDPKTTVAVTLASGAPALNGLLFELDPTRTFLGFLTIDSAPDEVKTWQQFFIRMTIGKFLRDSGITEAPNPAQINRVWLRACSGMPVSRIPISAVPQHIAKGDYPFELVENGLFKDLELIVYNPNEMLDANIWAALNAETRGYVHKARARGLDYVTLNEHVVRTIRSAQRGPERYGLDLPVVLLAAIDRTMSESKASNKIVVETCARRGAGTVAIEAVKSGQSLPVLPVLLSEDKMSAQIGKYDFREYAAVTDNLTVEWLTDCMGKAGVISGFSDQTLAPYIEKLKKGEEIKGVLVAEGQKAQNGEGPTIKLANDGFKEGAFIVSTGDVVAEMEFAIDPVAGFKVTGEEIPCLSEELPDIIVGEGVAQSGHKFVATKDGTPIFDGSSISVQSGFVIEGSVNATNGILELTESTIIKGNIEAGANIFTTGDLHVEGSIFGGKVFVLGNLTVTKGVSGPKKNSLKVSGDATVGYIENAHMSIRGSLVVEKTILSSHIDCFDSVTVNSNRGMIVGGVVSSESSISVAYVGRPDGAMTELRLGCDQAATRAFENRSKRAKTLEDLLEAETARMKSLLRKRPDQRGNKWHEEVEELKPQISRLTKIVENLDRYVDQAKQRLSDNKQAFAVVKESLEQNVKLSIANKRFKITSAIGGVMVKYKGGIIVAAPYDGEADNKKLPEAG